MHALRTIWVWLVPAALCAVLLHSTSALAADTASLTVHAPDQMDLGDEATVTAVLMNSQGQPIPGAGILLLTTGSFLSVEGVVELDRATTDAQGIARLRYQARTANTVTLTVSFPGNGQYSPSQASTEISVSGTAQLYQEAAGVRLPVIGVWLLVGVLGVAWSIYFGVMVLVTLIAWADLPARGR